MAGYEELRLRHVSDASAMLSELVQRIEWPTGRLSGYQRTAARQLLQVAKERSPWHRKRLAEFDPDRFELDMLVELPVMTKDDLMDHFDEIVTDHRLRLDTVEQHLQHLVGDAYLFDRFHAAASGGSCGRRGVFVYDWDGWIICYLSWIRHEVRARQLRPTAEPHRFATVTSATAGHMSSSLAQTFSSPDVSWTRLPVTLPPEEIVLGLNDVQPEVLLGYPSALFPLVHEAEAGRLKIRPRRVIAAGEALLPEIRAALEATWKAPVVNWWATSEACTIAASCGFGPGLHLSEDLSIVEPVDGAGLPVGVGTCSEKVYLTNLFNHTLPLIRYELTDQITLMDAHCPCCSSLRLIDDPYGRLDDVFVYRGGLSVHPHVFRSPLSRRRHVVEYQVSQTNGGAAIATRCTGPIDVAALEAEIVQELRGRGLENPDVTVVTVESLERQHTGKLKRFVPLATPD